jgi:hypothetical protein
MNLAAKLLQDRVQQWPAIVIHGLPHALAALAPGLPVTLLCAPGAAMSGGCLWWRGVVAGAMRQHPKTPCIDILDCADAPGLAMGALREGQRWMILWPECPAFAAVSGAASTIGAAVIPARPPALDLAGRGAARHLPAHLAGEPYMGRDSAAPLG